MDSPKGIVFPGNWLIDAGVATCWPYKEGVWVEQNTDPILRVVCVYLALREILEAQKHLAECNEQFVNEHAGAMLSCLKPLMKKASIGEKVKVPESPISDAEAIKIYKPWVDKWALSSIKMLELVVGLNEALTVLNLLGIKEVDITRGRVRLGKLGDQARVSWVWRTLFSSEYRRLDQTRRELARRSLQSKGYYCLRERTLTTYARYWVCVRILGFSQTLLLQKVLPDKDQSNFSRDVLKPFDSALLGAEAQPKPGRPLGSKTSMNTNDIISDIAEILRD